MKNVLKKPGRVVVVWYGDDGSETLRLDVRFTILRLMLVLITGLVSLTTWMAVQLLSHR